MNRLVTQVLTDLVEQIEAGTIDWQKCWSSGMPYNVSRQAEYHGINVLNLWVSAVTKQYPTQEWATYKQWQEMGCQVRQGEVGTYVMYYGIANEGDKEREFPFIKTSKTFNAAQVDGYERPVSDVRRIVDLDEWFASFRIPLIEAPGPVYMPTKDCIGMPPIANFTSADGYYVSLFHELAHATGHPSRLKREAKALIEDRQSYAAEELVAEMASAFIGAHFQLQPDQHASYLASWLKAWPKDKRPAALFFAARHAKDAYNWCLANGSEMSMSIAAQ